MFRRKKKEVTENPLQDKVAGKIASVFIKTQNGFAYRMNKCFGTMKTKNIKIWLLAFCIVSGGLSIYFFMNAIVSKPKAKFRIEQVRMPKHFDKSGDEVMENPMPDDIYQQIQDYKKYMDSLGEPIRPGLADSMRILEEIYLQQKQK
jgi:hypothetical protein